MNNKNTKQLKDKLVKLFHKFIRERDKDKPCISCGQYTTLQAGHFYSGGHYSALRFDEDNVHGQCLRCNTLLGLIDDNPSFMENIANYLNK